MSAWERFTRSRNFSTILNSSIGRWCLACLTRRWERCDRSALASSYPIRPVPFGALLPGRVSTRMRSWRSWDIHSRRRPLGDLPRKDCIRLDSRGAR
jgi:hypothetical protein